MLRRIECSLAEAFNAATVTTSVLLPSVPGEGEQEEGEDTSCLGVGLQRAATSHYLGTEA